MLPQKEDGGFHLVPGFHHQLEEFAKLTPELRRSFGKIGRFIVILTPTRFTNMQ